MFKRHHRLDDFFLGFVVRCEQEHAKLNALIQHADRTPSVASDQHLALQLDGPTRQVRDILGHRLGELSFQHAGPTQHNGVLTDHKNALVFVGEDLLAKTEPDAVE